MSGPSNSRRRPETGRKRRDGGRRPRSIRRGDGERRSDAAPPGPDEHLAIVRFKGNRKGYYHNRRHVEFKVGDFCLVEADRGRDLGQVAYLGPGRPHWWEDAVHQGVVDLAGAHDIARLADLRREERDAWFTGLKKIHDHRLEMQLVGIERRWDRNKLTFYFLADERVDFRALVRDLAGVFRTRIELRQIGVRDEARLKGGLGICGREFCCSTFLVAFESVGLRMAKNQQLPLNPAKLSGPCGRLRCCLAYENAQYRDMLRSLPKVNSEVTWSGRPGRTRKLDPLQQRVTVQMLDGDREWEEVVVSELTFEKPAVGSQRDVAGSRRRRDGGRGE